MHGSGEQFAEFDVGPLWAEDLDGSLGLPD
jgi:hypothetical protein